MGEEETTKEEKEEDIETSKRNDKVRITRQGERGEGRHRSEGMKRLGWVSETEENMR